MLRLSLPYVSFKSDEEFLATKQSIYHIKYWRWSFYIHVFTSIFPLLAGLSQFSYWLLRRHRKFHRTVGYAYVLIVVFISGPASFLMGLHANGGLPARASFTLLAFLWVLFTALAWYFATKGNMAAHRAFMIRSYALTLSAITLRVYTLIFHAIEVDARPIELYITTAWLSWVPNLLIAELIINMKKPPADIIQMGSRADRVEH